MAELVDCSGPWQYRVLETFEVDDQARYPGELFFFQQAWEHCDPRFTIVLSAPTEFTWEIGIRTVVCTQESFGLSVVDPAKLDRLINPEGVGVGGCFNLVPETDWRQVEMVGCSESWEFQVYEKFTVPWDGEYPGVDYFEIQAGQECDEIGLHFEPTAASWEWGDREVVCVREPAPQG